ncbi:hypothetical protein [Paracoccus shanxieyensis]|uniref:Uncharacterized protein n=1 Tax=Paracoccus shanxieyensis TaxID=2675752 RepID=A0A6L6IZ49_9RHOB|nr:hypothetical protein [Paracoccus shanxieyensis]MTH65189.1 hypothetical protein [Paracoccus shanxieyensis]MTH88333.1 hypothetical protein [Paracoccus shanxieyensis]
MRISITFDQTSDLSPAMRRGIETTVLTPAEAESAEWRSNHLTYRTARPEDEVVSDWEIHGFPRDSFAEITITPWVERRRRRG